MQESQPQRTMTESNQLSATFWGVRGGYPVPGSGTTEFGGNTTCLEVWAGPHLVIIDAGTGVVGLGAKLMDEARRAGTDNTLAPIQGTLLFTHGHHDHTQGLPFFAPLRSSRCTFDVLGPRVFGQDWDKVLSRALHPSIYPAPLEQLRGMRSVRNVYEQQVIVLTHVGAKPVLCELDDGAPLVPPGAVEIRLYHSGHHPRGGSMIYNIRYHNKGLVFATDTEGYEGGDQRLIDLAQDTDLLIHDAEYNQHEYTGPPLVRQGWGHSTWCQAVEVGQKANVKRLALTHHHAPHDDATLQQIEQEAQAVFPAAFVAREGTTIVL
jgi:phosphoribosyl 1,2-cyclic phosphodiesterase